MIWLISVETQGWSALHKFPSLSSILYFNCEIINVRNCLLIREILIVLYHKIQYYLRIDTVKKTTSVTIQPCVRNKTIANAYSCYAFPIWSEEVLYTSFYKINILGKLKKITEDTKEYITKTRLYNFDPLKPHFYIVKLGFTGVYIIFNISAQKHRLCVLVRTASARRF